MNKRTLKALEILKRLEQEKIESLLPKLHTIEKEREDMFLSQSLAREKMLKEASYADEVGAYLTTSYFSKALQDKIVVLGEKIIMLNAKITPLRTQLSNYYAQFKMLELLINKGFSEIKEEEKKKEQAVLDEFATTAFARRHE